MQRMLTRSRTIEDEVEAVKAMYGEDAVAWVEDDASGVKDLFVDIPASLVEGVVER